jgi:hypothetical protein
MPDGSERPQGAGYGSAAGFAAGMAVASAMEKIAVKMRHFMLVLLIALDRIIGQRLIREAEVRTRFARLR